MLIRAYGLFWSADEVEWYPGGGNKGRYMLLGHQGERKPKLRLADFRMQSGLYTFTATTVRTTWAKQIASAGV